MSPQNNKNGRSFKNFIVDPRVQVKYALLNASIVMMSLGTAIFFSQFTISRAQSLLEGPEISTQIISGLGSTMLLFDLCLLVGAGAFSFVINILITHRFVGPIVAIRRYLSDIQQNRESKLILREDDELRPLADYLEKIKPSSFNSSSQNKT